MMFQARLDGDENAHNSRAASFVPHTEYGVAMTYFSHFFRLKQYHFAQVRFYKNLKTDSRTGLVYNEKGLRDFGELGEQCMIETKGIDALVGCITNSTSKRTYILERDIIIGRDRLQRK